VEPTIVARCGECAIKERFIGKRRRIPLASLLRQPEGSKQFLIRSSYRVQRALANLVTKLFDILKIDVDGLLCAVTGIGSH
jgi:hypothetical protein